MNELKSINRLEEAGFTHDQAKAVVEVVEEGLQRGFDRFVDVLDRRLGEFELRMKAEFEKLRSDMHELRADLMKEQRDLLLKYTAIVSIVAAVFGLVLKLTGN